VPYTGELEPAELIVVRMPIRAKVFRAIAEDLNGFTPAQNAQFYQGGYLAVLHTFSSAPVTTVIQLNNLAPVMEFVKVTGPLRKKQPNEPFLLIDFIV
jgi:hypothetical protein